MKHLIIFFCLAVLLTSISCYGAQGKPLEPRPTFKWKDWNVELSPDGNIQHLFLSYDEGEELEILTRLAKEMEEERRKEHGVEPNEWKVVYCLSKETDMIFRAVDGTRYRETAGMGRGDLEWALLNEQQYYDAAYAYSRGNVKMVATDRILEEPLLGEYHNVCFFWPRDWADLGMGIDSHDYDSVVGHYYPGETRPWARGGTGGGGAWCDWMGHTSVQFAPGREVGGSLGDLGKITLHEWLHQIDGQRGWKCGYLGLPGQYSPGNFNHGAHLFWMWNMLPPKMWQTMRMQAPLMSPANKPQDRYNGFIRNWLVLGEFDLPDEFKTTGAGLPHPKALDTDTINAKSTMPSNEKEEAGKIWKLITTPLDKNSLNMRNAFLSPHKDAYAYAHAYIYSPGRRDALLWLGSFEPFVANLNGHSVLKCWRGTAQDEAYRRVVLMKGWNRLLVKKLDQEDRAWNLFARFTDLEHVVFEDMKFATDEPENEIVATNAATPVPPAEVKRYKWEWPYSNDWFGSFPILTEEHLEAVLGVKGVRILGAPGTLNGRNLDWKERRYTLIDVSSVDKPENILSRIVPWNAEKATLENDVLLNNVLNMSREGADGRSYESMAMIRYKKPGGGHGDLVFVRADMMEPFMDLAKFAGSEANPADNILGYICRDSKTFLVFDTDLGEQLPINELDMLAVKDESVTLTAAPSVARVLRGKPVSVNVTFVAGQTNNPSLTAREFGTDKKTNLGMLVDRDGVYNASFPVDTTRPAGLITYIIEAAYEKDGKTLTVSKPVPINLVDAVGIEIRVEGPEIIQTPKQTVTMKVTNNLDRAVSCVLTPKLPKGFKVKPRSQKIILSKLDDIQTFTFDITISKKAADGWLPLAAEVKVSGEAVCRGVLDVYKSFDDVLTYEDFEDGIGGDFGYTNAHYQVKLNREAAKFGRQCLEVFDRGGQRYGHVLAFGRGFWPEKRLPDTQYVYDTNVYPIVDFWFKTNAKTDNLGLHVVLDNGENGYGVLLNGFWVQQWVPRVMIGQADFTPDGEWHHIVLNIDEMLDEVLGDTSHFVREILIGDTRTFSSGWWYYFDAHHHYIDDFQIRRNPIAKGAKLEHRLKSPSNLPILSKANPVPALDSKIVSGMKATLRLPRLGFMPWDEIRFDYYLSNRSDEDLTVATWNNSRLWEINITTADGTPVTDGWVSRYWKPEQQNPPADTKRHPRDFGIPNEKNHFRQLKPGETLKQSMRINDLFADWAANHEKKLESGNEYIIKLRYRSSFTGEEFGHNAWTGTVESNPVKLNLIGVPAMEEELQALSASIEPVRRSKACAQLGKGKYEPAIPALCKAALNDEDGDVRLNAVWALGEFPRVNPEKPETAELVKPCVEALIKALDDENWRVGEYAAASLGRLGDRSATPHLLKRLDNESKWIRRKTALALHDMNDPASADKLSELMKDKSREIRLEAQRALTNLVNAASQPLEGSKNHLRNIIRTPPHLVDERKRIEQRLVELQKIEQERVKEITPLEQKIAEFQKKIETIAGERKDIEQKVDELKKANDQTKAEEIKAFEQEIADFSKSERTQADEMKKTEQKIAELKKAGENQVGEKKKLEKRLAELNAADEKRNTEGSTQQEKVDELQQVFNKLFNLANVAKNDEYWEIRRRWINALPRLMKNTDVGPLLMAGIRDKNERIREAAIWKLGDYLGELGRISNDKGNPEIAAGAKEKLEKYRAEATPIIIENLNDYYDGVRRKSVEQFQRITGKDLIETTGKDSAYWLRKYPRPGDTRWKKK